MELTIPLRPEEKAAKPMRVCVTGATGYVAGHIVQRLLAAGHTVGAVLIAAYEAEGRTVCPTCREQLSAAGRVQLLPRCHCWGIGVTQHESAAVLCAAVHRCCVQQCIAVVCSSAHQ